MPTEEPSPTPGRNAISFVAFCYEEGDQATIELSDFDNPNDPRIVHYEVLSGDNASVIVHKTGGGNDELYQQPGQANGTIIAQAGIYVGDNRTANQPCPDGTTALKFQGENLSEGTTLSFPADAGEGNQAIEVASGANEPQFQFGPLAWAVGGVGLVAGLAFRRR